MRFLLVLPLAMALAGVRAATDDAMQADALREALTFHAPFDDSVDAIHAAGDPRLYTAPSFRRRPEATPGLPTTGETIHVRGEGRFGDAIRFTVRRKPLVFFNGADNVAYRTSDWSGTVSFWLNVDPEGELEPGFCDPIQVTPYAWNNAAFFVEFEKTPEAIPFRLGVYADPDVWNPEGRQFEDIPAEERPLVTVGEPPFAKGRWTHVVFTFERFNTGQADGVARLYLDGQPVGELSPRQQTFTWDADQSAIAMGLSYVGLFDELSVFNRALTAEEVAALHALEGGVTSLF